MGKQAAKGRGRAIPQLPHRRRPAEHAARAGEFRPGNGTARGLFAEPACGLEAARFECALERCVRRRSVDRHREEWFDAPDQASRKGLAERIQLQALQTVPYVPLGQVYQPTAYRSDLRDIVPAHLPVFWNAHRG